MTEIKIAQNNVRSTNDPTNSFMYKLITSVRLMDNGILEVDNNNIPLSEPIMQKIKLLNRAGQVNLRSNRITASEQTLTHFFENFSLLTSLNLGIVLLHPSLLKCY